MSNRSGDELRAIEGRYQTQLVQDKARQIEMYLHKYSDLVKNLAGALELSNDLSILSSVNTEKRLGTALKEDPNLLALYIKPVSGESLSVFRAEKVSRDEIERISAEALSNLDGNGLNFGRSNKIASTNEVVLPIVTAVRIDNKISAAVVAIVTLKDFGRIISGANQLTAEQLWEAGLPIVFVVDQNGQAVFYPESAGGGDQHSLTDLKIVSEWMSSNQQIQSALFPFSTNYLGENYEMIGAYSTAEFSKGMRFGVIVMQDEKKALASVGEMRRQTWIISIAFAVLAMIAGSFLARQLNSPLSSLVSAAQKIASGDLSSRIRSKKIKEFDTLGTTFNVMSDRLEEHIAKLARAAEENRELFVGTVKALAAAIDGKDRYTRGHSERVSRVSVAIGQRLNLDEQELETLRISALLHDVGKIAIDDSILKKPAALTNEEYEIMKTHPQKGFKIMSQIPAMKDFLPGMYMHHEMINGQGYPQGLKGDEIPLQAKIVSVADTFDAMTIDRPYQKGMSLEAALTAIKGYVGTRYDGKVVEALVQACADGQIGVGTVRLNPKFRAESEQNRENAPVQPPVDERISKVA